MLSAPLREVLAAYYRWKHPTNSLFPGGKGKSDCPITTTTIFRICTSAARLAGVAKPVRSERN
jgi:hypothetical protein